LPFARLLLLCVAVLSLASIANTASVPLRALLVVATVVAIAAALALDRGARAKLFPSGMLSFSRPVGKCFWIIFLLAMAGSPTSVYLPLLVQILHDVRPAAAGYFYAGQSFSWTCAAVVTSRIATRHVRGAILLGPLLMASGLGGLAVFVADGPVGAIAGFIALAGVGLGTCWAHVGNVVLGSARADEEEATAALIPSTQL